MPHQQPALSVDEFCARGVVADADVGRLRRLLFTDAPIQAEEARALIDLNHLCSRHEPAWRDFYIEALTEHLINDVSPRGYLTAGNAQWLIEQIAADGVIANKLDFQLLVSLIDRARWSPEVLVQLALVQVLRAVKDGSGWLRSSGGVGPGQICDADVDLLRRILYAFGGECGLPVTRAEAEVLFAINDALVEPLTPSWADFFVRAIVHAVMAASGYKGPTREEALSREATVLPQGPASVDAMLAALDAGKLGQAYRKLSSEDAALTRLERQRIEIITNSEVTQGDISWLAQRLNRTGPLSPTEDLVLAVFARVGATLHPSLDPILARVAQAA